MSLRDHNKGQLVPVAGALRQKHGVVARPDERGTNALRKAESRQPAVFGKTRIGAVIDATNSREKTWAAAQEIQRQMFARVVSVGTMALRLVHYGGSEITDNGWEANPDKVRDKMGKVRCSTGPTQVLNSLRLFVAEEASERAGSVILIGDAFEINSNSFGGMDSFDGIPDVTRLLWKQETKVYCFLEGRDPDAERAFRQIARETGGTFARFGSDMPLDALCEGVALLSVGGETALQRLQNTQARMLLLLEHNGP